MTKQEIIDDKEIILVCQPTGKIFIDIHGKDVKQSKLKSVLFYGNGAWTGTAEQNVSLDFLFFHLVRNGKLPVPTDYDTCSKCGGTGNVGYIQHGGICYKCNGFGYLLIK